MNILDAILIPIIVLLLFLAGEKNIVSNEENCYLIEETFESSSMKVFLENNTYQIEITRLFQADSSNFSVLVISDGKVIYANTNDSSKWAVIQQDKQYYINNANLNKIVTEYSKKGICYKVECPDDFIILGRTSFQIIWIKTHGEIKFIYYAVKCGLECLSTEDKSKIIPLMELVGLLQT